MFRSVHQLRSLFADQHILPDILALPPKEAPMVFKVTPAIAASMLALGTVTGHAQGTIDTIDKYVTFSGFGTLGVVHSDYRKADFVGNVVQPSGAEGPGNWSATPDSDLGVQANFTFTDALSGVLQVLSRDNAYGQFKPTIEWANLQYEITSDLKVRVGRMVLPTYDHSDTQNVGYALPWVRIPIEIAYRDAGLHSDGLDVLYRVKTGSVTQNLQAQWGRTPVDLPGFEFTSAPAEVIVFSDTLQYGDTSLRLAYQKYNASGFPADRLQVTGAGLTYDPGDWFMMADSSYSREKTFGDSFAWYISGGIRLGRFAPYVIYATTRAQSTGTSGLKSLGDDHSVSAGVRWDFAKNFDAKLQVQRVTIDTLDDPASFADFQAGVRIGDKANVVSLTLDFVF
jgi:predicted porin